MTIQSTATVLDLRGLNCPLPALRTRKALRKLNAGDLLTVECTDPLAAIDIPNLLRETGDVLERISDKDDAIVFQIRRKRASGEVRTLAALVFEDSDAANRLVADFARDLARLGYRIAGMIQIADAAQACDCRDTLLQDVETGERVSILQDLGRYSQSCRVDTSAIAHAANLISGALQRAPEILFINRFGKLEIEGKGMLAEIGAAAAAGVPTIVCVPARYLDQWRAFAMDLDEELSCSDGALRRWWSDVQRQRVPDAVSFDAAL